MRAAVHSPFEISTLCATRDIEVMWLPPYTPWLNPTEYVNKIARDYLRRQYVVPNNMNLLCEQLSTAFWECSSSHKLCNIFDHCGIFVQNWEREWASGNNEIHRRKERLKALNHVLLVC